jgi:hypothetical protein
VRVPDVLGRRREIKQAGLLILIGAMFLLAGVLKAYDSRDLRSLLLFDGFLDSYVPILAQGLILIELAVGLYLICGFGSMRAPQMGLALVIIYSLQLGFLLMFTEPPTCSCFGGLKLYNSTRHEAMFGFLRNAMIVCGLVWIIHRNRGGTATSKCSEKDLTGSQNNSVR